MDPIQWDIKPDGQPIIWESNPPQTAMEIRQRQTMFENQHIVFNPYSPFLHMPMPMPMTYGHGMPMQMPMQMPIQMLMQMPTNAWPHWDPRMLPPWMQWNPHYMDPRMAASFPPPPS